MIQNIILHHISNFLPVKTILGGIICCPVAGGTNGWVFEKNKSQVTETALEWKTKKLKYWYYEAGEICE